MNKTVIILLTTLYSHECCLRKLLTGFENLNFGDPNQ